jgi:spore maturation protein CgeB
MLNWNTHLTTSLSMYDLVATYSERSVPILEHLGARRVAWVPLAGDPALHSAPAKIAQDAQTYGADVTFIGGWRPEREAVLSQLTAFEVKIWGPDWGRRCKGKPAVLKAWQGRPLYGADFARAVAHSKVNLNVIDPTNYPAANMRFFEIPTAGGLQVSSACPEMASEFCHGKHLFYYNQTEDLPALIRSLLSDQALRTTVARAAHAKVGQAHTYVHRAEQILALYRQALGHNARSEGHDDR